MTDPVERARRPASAFWLAWRFLTVLPGPPLGEVTSEVFARSRTWFPFVGLALGLLWAATDRLLALAPLAPGLRGALLLCVPLLATGFLHLDGLLDCADALLGSRSPERRLQILKDVHLGAFAFGIGSLWLLIFWQILSQSPDWRLLVAAPVLARGILLVPSHLFPYARPVGTASHSGVALPPTGWILPAAATLAAAALFPVPALAALACQFLVAAFAARRLGGGITGDVYGAMILLSESAALLADLLLRGHP